MSEIPDELTAFRHLQLRAKYGTIRSARASESPSTLFHLSSRPRYAALAQLVERWREDPEVGGANPSGGTIQNALRWQAIFHRRA